MVLQSRRTGRTEKLIDPNTKKDFVAGKSVKNIKIRR